MAARRYLFLVCLLLQLQLQPVAAQARRALLIGIDDYQADRTSPSLPAPSIQATGRTHWSNLAGSVSDVLGMQELLITRFGFQRDNIKLLTNQAAKREAILEAIGTHLIASAKQGDEIVFFYAGHGSQVANSRSEEPDKKDETIVPADSRLGARDIRDKELLRLFHRILDRGAHLTVILDSCHSGSGARGLPAPGRARLLPPDPRDVADAEDAGARPEDRGALVLSASQDDELAFEAEDEKGTLHGAFSLALLDAMRRSGTGEPAEQIFLRAKAHLQTEVVRQEPVLAGDATRAFFGGKTERLSGKRVVALRQVGPDGALLLQGGWAHGLQAGSELELSGQRAARSRVRIRVTAMNGLADCEARLVEPDGPGARPFLRAGDLFELVGWAAPPHPPLRVWIPDAGERGENLLAQARRLRELARAAEVEWVSDPTEVSPSHLLSWEKGRWRLASAGATLPEDLGVNPDPAEILRRLTTAAARVRLFVHLPAPAGLVQAVQLGAGSEHDAVEATDGPEGAAYVLVGRLHGSAVEFAWVRPGDGATDRPRSPLPVRSDWHAWRDNPSALAPTLTDSALRIAKIRAWLTLESPPGGEFPYHLALRDAHQVRVIAGSVLPAGSPYGLALTAQHGDLDQPVARRYIYVFVLDSFGASVLLFPPPFQGNVETRFPLPFKDGSLPTEIPLGPQPGFKIGEPFGLDTYFLLTAEEAIPNPWVLAVPGVRSRGPQGRTALEELLSQRGASHRGGSHLVPVTWSMEKLTFESGPRGFQGGRISTRPYCTVPWAPSPRLLSISRPLNPR